jgi:endonuclease YncB( thermonuclease family)
LTVRAALRARFAGRRHQGSRNVPKFFVSIVLSFALAAAAHAQTGAKPSAKKAQPKPPPAPTELVGTVSRVVDGDTFWLKTDAESAPEVVRLEGIDAPESCQPGGAEATTALGELVLNRIVTVRIVARDEHGRVVGKVYDGGKDIGDRLVRDGRAWSSRFRYDRGPYVAEERMAQALKRGVHADPAAIQPRDFRQRHGPCPGTQPVPAAPVAPTVAPALPTPPPKPRAQGGPSTAGVALVSYRCDGRRYCSQMTSCAEATWFLRNCPGVKMDGNNDGVPCEQQHCR